jgi:hypothetical protein
LLISGSPARSSRASVFTIFAIATLPTLAAQAPSAPAPDAPIAGVRHVAGLENVKFQKGGTLSVQGDALLFDTGKSQAKVPIASIDDIFLGSETTQSTTKTARVAKVAAMAAPYESGRALSLFYRTKVDILTVSFHDASGGAHGAILAIPKGLGAGMRAQLIAAGAHASPVVDEPQKEGKQP